MSSFSRSFSFGWTLAAALLITACATTRAGETSYSEGAQEGYEQGLEHLEDQNYEQAIAAFEQVRTKYPYSAYAALAELRIADTDFQRNRFLEAIDGYQRFVRFHPTHELLDWASFRIGESHYRGIPSDFFIFPSPSERDQTEARSARQSLSDFLTRFPNSEHAPKAREALDRVMELLVRHELYAAEFYASRKKWLGAAGRYEYVLKSFPSGPHVPAATVALASSLEKAGEPGRAAEILDRFLAGQPTGKEAQEARKLRDALRSRKVEAAPPAEGDGRTPPPVEPSPAP